MILENIVDISRKVIGDLPTELLENTGDYMQQVGEWGLNNLYPLVMGAGFALAVGIGIAAARDLKEQYAYHQNKAAMGHPTIAESYEQIIADLD